LSGKKLIFFRSKKERERHILLLENYFFKKKLCKVLRIQKELLNLCHEVTIHGCGFLGFIVLAWFSKKRRRVNAFLLFLFFKSNRLSFRMFKSLLFVCVGLLCLPFSKAQSTLQIGATTLEVDTLVSGLDIPWEIQWGPDNFIWMTERKGIVSRINPTTGEKIEISNLVASVYQQAESGLLGMVLHPEFDQHPEVFLAYTYLQNGSVLERLVKYSYDGMQLSNPVELLDGIPGNTTHNGARLLFLPDQTLLMSTGDGQNLNLPQDVNSLAGKILRVNTDGSVPEDNPLEGNPVYSFGHRNVQGLYRHENGTIWLSEHGAATDDEFQRLIPGGNYGWPNVEGFCDGQDELSFCAQHDVVEPLIAWTPTIAPSDLVFYQNEDFPEWNNTFLMTVLKDKKLISIRLNEEMTEIVEENHQLTNLFGRLRDICIGPQNEIYLATNGPFWSNTQPNTHTIVRLKVVGSQAELATPQLNMMVYPNPVHDKFRINLEGMNAQVGELVLENNLGQQMLIANIENQITELDISHLPSGVYVMTIQFGQHEMRHSRIVKW
jgi:aldose sugar dehydrogenase